MRVITCIKHPVIIYIHISIKLHKTFCYIYRFIYIYFSDKVSSLKNTRLSRWWAEIKAMGGMSVNLQWWHQLLSTDIPDTDVLAELFNNFLYNLTAHFSPLQTDTIDDSAVPIPEEFLVTKHQAYKALKSIKVNKSAGPDPIPQVVWKVFAFELAPVVSYLYNNSLTEGAPDCLKTSIVIPVPKTSPPKVLEEDLRPITLTSPLAKVMEGFTLRTLTRQVIDNLDCKQFSVSGKSTTHALVYLLHLILEALDLGNNYVRLFFADFSKGFDLVDHQALLVEMNALNVHPVIIRWICAFLTGRSQRVKISDSLSSVASPCGGIPQGTKLAPMLFAILVNRLVSNWPARVKYVDDTTILEIIPRCSPSYLQHIVNDINQFASARGMRLNPKKCKELRINFLEYSPFTPPTLDLGGVSVQLVDNYKLLGVYITSNISWNVHVDHMLKKANKRLYALRVLRKAGVPKTDLVSIYCSLVRSVLEYAVPVWSAIPAYLGDILERVQRKALHIIYPNLDYFDALNHSGLISLCNRRVDLTCSFIEKAKRSEPLERLLESLKVNVDHGYSLRSGTGRVDIKMARTQRFSSFCTMCY